MKHDSFSGYLTRRIQSFHAYLVSVSLAFPLGVRRPRRQVGVKGRLFFLADTTPCPQLAWIRGFLAGSFWKDMYLSPEKQRTAVLRESRRTICPVSFSGRPAAVNSTQRWRDEPRSTQKSAGLQQVFASWSCCAESSLITDYLEIWLSARCL